MSNTRTHESIAVVCFCSRDFDWNGNLSPSKSIDKQSWLSFFFIFIIFQAIPLTMAMDRFVFKLMRLQKRKEKRKEKKRHWSILCCRESPWRVWKLEQVLRWTCCVTDDTIVQQFTGLLPRPLSNRQVSKLCRKYVFYTIYEQQRRADRMEGPLLSLHGWLFTLV